MRGVGKRSKAPEVRGSTALIVVISLLEKGKQPIESSKELYILIMTNDKRKDLKNDRKTTQDL